MFAAAQGKYRAIGHLKVIVVALAFLFAWSCEPVWKGTERAPRKVELIDVTMGTELREDQSIARATTKFEPGDTAYVSLRLFGQATTARVAVKWFQGERMLESNHKTLSPDGLSRTQFSWVIPYDAPSGEFEAVVFIDHKRKKRVKFSVTSPRG